MGSELALNETTEVSVVPRAWRIAMPKRSRKPSNVGLRSAMAPENVVRTLLRSAGSVAPKSRSNRKGTPGSKVMPSPTIACSRSPRAMTKGLLGAQSTDEVPLSGA